MLRLWLRALVVALFATLLHAQQQDESPASTFFLEQTETQFSVSLAKDSSDVYIYFTSPAYSWVGIGFGEGMGNSLMLIMYPNEKGDNLTVSPRLSSGHTEPSFSSSINLTLLNGTGISDDMFVLRAICHTCRVWPGGFLDNSSTAHPMLFAFGPGSRLHSNDPNAALRRHVRYGTFTMDMRAASSDDARVPGPGTQLRGVELGNMVKDHDRKNLAHAFMGCIALFVFWPVNVVLAGFFRNIKIHVVMSIAILVFLVISFALGIATSPDYNRSKHYTSPHQLLAFLSLLPLLLLSLLPLPSLASLKKFIPRLHTPLTLLTYTLLVLTGGLGLHLSAAATTFVTVYVSIALLVFAFFASIAFCVRRRGSAYARATTRRRLGEEDERDYASARWGVRKKLSSSWSEMSGGEREREGEWQQAQEYGYGHAEPEGHRRADSAGSWRGAVGGGTMPGPQYLMNMHPGVPVYVK